MKSIKCAVFAMLAILAMPQAFACYTVYNRANQIIYNARTPPVNISYQIHEVLPSVYPGGHMVFGNEPDCPLYNSVVYIRPVSVVYGEGRTQRYRPKPYRN